jgi:hypothetical protein
MAIQTWFDIRHGLGVPEISRPRWQERPDAGLVTSAAARV